MEPRSVLETARGLDRAILARLGQGQATQVRFAVDEHGADAAGALPAAVFRRGVADALAQRSEQIGAAVDEDCDVAAVVAELDRDLGHSRPPFSPRCRAASAAN